MGRNIDDTKLFKQLRESEIDKSGISPLSSAIAQHLQKISELLLGEIGAYMPNYTLHNIDHVVNVLDIIGELLPPDVRLNCSELTIIIYSAALHDIGMLVNREEAEELKKTEAYRRILAKFDRDADEKDILSELVRRSHAQRSCEYIDRFKKDVGTYGLDFKINGYDFSRHLKNIILAHACSVVELTNENYPTDALVDHERVNVRFLALLLRLGDMLDFDKSRTPLFLLEHKKIRNPKSILEWEKHLSINGLSISSTQLEFHAECKSAEVHRCVLDFLDYIEYERKETMDCIRKMNTPDRYLQLNDVVKYRVDDDGSYIYEDLDISFDYKKVLSILMGTELYSSSEVFLRELLQNAYDACFVRKKLSENSGDNSYQPYISIHFDTNAKILSVEDNGIGMDMSSIKNYVTKIGSSYYKSKEFQSELIDYTPISNFGIGILSCFMVSNSINIDSLRYSTALTAREPINITLNLDNSFVERRPSSRTTTGTKISLYIHDKFAEELSLEKMQQIVEDNTAYQSIPIKLSFDGNEILLNKQCISIPSINGYPGIDVIHVDNDTIEGYLVLYSGEHQSLVKYHKICQQGFKINGKGGNDFGLKPSFLRFMGYDINLKRKTLSVKASREGIIKDAAFGLLQNMISDLVLDHYKDTPTALISYIEDGSHNIITKRQREYDFLSNHISFIVVDTKRNEILHNYPLFAKLTQEKCLCKIGFISLNLYRCNTEAYGKEILSSCDYVVLASSDMHYFVQLAKPYCVTASEVISTIPGLIYHLISYDFTRTVELKDYSNNYNYEGINKDVQLISPKPVFCYITNNQYNFLRLTYNRHHPWGKLFTEQSEILCIKKASIVLKENIETAMFSTPRRPLKYLAEYSGEYYRFHSNTWDHSEKTIGIFESEIVSSINDYLYKTIDASLLGQYGLIDKPLTIDDFISWWFVKE